MIQPLQITQIIQLIEARIGLSANTLERIGVVELLPQMITGDVDEYIHKLRFSDEDSPEWQRLIHDLTIGETYFLRDKQHFAILRENIIPRILMNRRQEGNLRLSIWCVGCATGEEPYSVATVLYETVPDLARWNINIIATDVNQRAIETAKKGIYRDWSFRQTPPAFRKRYFAELEDGWELDLRIREMVEFHGGNVLNGIPLAQVDIIFCRHVLMYFSREHLEEAEAILHRTLAPNGWLVLGQAEALRSKRDDWLLHLFPGTPIYQKGKFNEAKHTETISYPTRPDRPKPEARNDSPLYDDAVQAIHEDDPNRAEFHLSELLSEDPENAHAHILIASMLASRHAYPEAMAHLENALDMDGLLADAHYVKGLILLEQGNESGAIQCFNAAIYCQRDHVLASFLLGNLYAQQYELDKARRNWRNALRVVENLDAGAYVSDLSDMTAARLQNLLDSDLSEAGTGE